MFEDGTFRFTDGEIRQISYEIGYQVGIGNLFTGLPTLTRESLIQLLVDNGVVEFGVWTDNGVVYVDKCVHIEHFVEAVSLATANDELAVWDWANGVSLEVK
jgi:hypothetical protein